MYIKITYVGTLDGINGIWCGTCPEEAEITEERQVLYPEAGFNLKRISTEEVMSSVWLQDGDNMENYIEVKEQVTEDELKLTRGDVFRGLLRAKGITRAEIRALIEIMPQETEEEIQKRELALIDFDESLYFYRRNPLIDQLGLRLGITAEKMTAFFQTNDYTKLM